MVISQLKLGSPLRDRQVKQEQSDTGDQCMMILFHLSLNCEFGGAKKAHIGDQLIYRYR